MSRMESYFHEDANTPASPESPFEAWRGKSLSPAKYAKGIDIIQACQSIQATDQLATLATSPAGLVDDEVRRIACTSKTLNEGISANPGYRALTAWI